MRRITALFLLLVLALTPALAVQPDEMLKDPVLESRARALSEELRCLICQSQSIDESDATIARDLRILIRERLTKGDSDAAVKAFLVDRYGEYVLLKPAFAWHTALLWATPVVVLLIGGILAFGVMRRRRSTDPTALSADEEARIEALLARDR
ncbi:cytochrome c-type biogenesis protein CcmH [Kaistia dalseonensis]|uniref:Cytochrome c-type biogenesis protein n=1 Tax=Kaistia dalseonensis TaxID=410840 RepID=A0ABU0H1L6_9HYPH|nr:cytochrome c-type biogenesis protein [Kaistia dalseonensis]MCX5493100.1 cytochrome c-type biogenesis protein CcmH [Kaistia dalseonensis]MDQ0435655.1 cytochrome c-type biogenesis protein CcmH [Kaistia dalseonensis]